MSDKPWLRSLIESTIKRASKELPYWMKSEMIAAKQNDMAGRLRRVASGKSSEWSTWHDLCVDAADEIKRLRALVTSAYIEGHKVGHIGRGQYRDSSWHMSKARRELNGGE